MAEYNAGNRQRAMRKSRAAEPLGRSVRLLLVFAIASILFSYQLTTPILLSLGLDTALSNVIIKFSIAMIFAFVLFISLSSRRKLDIASYLIIICLFILGIRLLFDILILDIVPLFDNKFRVLSYYFLLTALPVISILFGLRSSDAKTLHIGIFWMLAAANVALIIYALSGGNITAQNAFGGRFQVVGEDIETAILNPISVGSAGTFLAAMSIGRLTALPSLSPVNQAATLTLMILGIANMLVGGSRGPALALAIIVVLNSYSLLRGIGGDRMIRQRALMWLYTAVAALAFAVFISRSATSIQVFDRFVTMFDSRTQGSLEQRDYALDTALQDFLNSPFFGSSYLTSDGQFPHNVAMDALMSTGVFGFLVFAIMFIYTAQRLTRMYKGYAGPYGYGIALTAICVFTLAMTSGALWQNPDLWAMLAVTAMLGNAEAESSSSHRTNSRKLSNFQNSENKVYIR